MLIAPATTLIEGSSGYGKYHSGEHGSYPQDLLLKTVGCALGSTTALSRSPARQAECGRSRKHVYGCRSLLRRQRFRDPVHRIERVTINPRSKRTPSCPLSCSPSVLCCGAAAPPAAVADDSAAPPPEGTLCISSMLGGVLRADDSRTKIVLLETGVIESQRLVAVDLDPNRFAFPIVRPGDYVVWFGCLEHRDKLRRRSAFAYHC